MDPSSLWSHPGWTVTCKNLTSLTKKTTFMKSKSLPPKMASSQGGIASPCHLAKPFNRAKILLLLPQHHVLDSIGLCLALRLRILASTRNPSVFVRYLRLLPPRLGDLYDLVSLLSLIFGRFAERYIVIHNLIPIRHVVFYSPYV